MTTTDTAMRLAFAKAVPTKGAITATEATVRSALRRKVGVTTRKTMWSVKRGNR